MFNISSFFAKVRTIQAKEELVRKSISDAIEMHAGFTPTHDSIRFEGSTAIIQNMTSSEKSRIFIKRAAILDQANMTQTIKKIEAIK